jgi:DNA invertase Pin-like site-specific DNA recombinase
VKRPVAYLRKSRVSSDRHVSWQIQEAAVRELAGRYGDGDTIEFLSDWNRSGREDKTHLRADYKRLLAEIAAGRVAVVYGYSLSRLARSLKEYASFAELCRDHGVPIRLAKEGEFDYASPHGRAIVGVLAVFAQMEAELAQERARDTIAARRARGDRLGSGPFGSRPGEDLAAVKEAFLRAGSQHGAAKLLNVEGRPTRTGKPWSGSAVASVLRHSVPDLLPPRPHRGAKAAAPFVFFRLLRCPCGTLLTGARSVTGKQPGYALYRCHAARSAPTHPRPFSVPETALVPWIMTEAARLRTPKRVQLAEENATARAALEMRRLRVLDLYEAGHIDAADRDRRLSAITEEIAKLDNVERLVDVPELDWSWPPERINAVLRAMWDHVELGEDMRPIEAAWLVPEWRQAVS